MSNLKRFLAMTLVMVMMIGALAMSTSAKLFDDVEALKDADLSAAIDLLSELGIAKGTTTETFDPESNVTRQQFALFVARIHTATPEYFVSNESVKDEIPFGDLKDPTYFLAIKHCYENNIINGKVAPTEDAKGTFDPEGEIMLQEAVTMLVRALGYDNQGLSYPVGFLAKAKEIGLLEGFGLASKKAESMVSRADMAGLLYNYFQGNYYEVNLVWNNSSAKYVEMVSLKPVAEKFGITKIEGYVTAIEGASLPMWVEDPYTSGILGAGGAVTDMHWVKIGTNDPISIRNAANPGNGGFDIIVSWVTPETSTKVSNEWVTHTVSGVTYAQMATVSTNERVVGHLRTNKAALGLDVDYKDLEGSRYLLGLKVIAYLDSANKGIKLPAPIVVGTKTRAAKSEIDGKVLSTDAGFSPSLNSFTFTDAEGVASKFIQYNFTGLDSLTYLNDNWTGLPINTIGERRRDEGDINYYTGYVFTSDTGRVLGSRGLAVNLNGADNADMLTLARIINTGNADKGAMDIDVIDNGFNRDGTPNRYVVFTPYEARYVRDDFEGNKRTYRGDGNQVNISNQANIQYVDATTFKASAPAGGNAYYLNDQGEYVIIKQKLVEVTANNTLGFVTEKDNNTTTFKIGVANKDNAGSYGYDKIDFSANAVKYATLYNRSNAASIAYTNSGTGNPNAYAMEEYDGFKIFTIGTAPYNYGFVGANTASFFVYRDVNAENGANRRWGYITSEYGSTTWVNGQSATIYEVHNIKTGAVELIYDVGPNRTVPYKAGEHISYMTVGFYTPNTHNILAAVNPLGERFKLVTDEITDYKGQHGDLASAIPLPSKKIEPITSAEAQEGLNKAVKALKEALTKAAKVGTFANTAAWRTAMGADVVTGAEAALTLYDTNVMDATGTVLNAVLGGGDVFIDSAINTWSATAITDATTKANVETYIGTLSTAALKAYAEAINATTFPNKSKAALAILAALEKYVADVEVVKKARFPDEPNPADPHANLAEMAGAIMTSSSLIADVVVNATYQMKSDAILKAFAKAIMEGKTSNGLWDDSKLDAVVYGLNETCFDQLGNISGGVLVMENELDTIRYRLSFVPFAGPKTDDLLWTATTNTSLATVQGNLYVQVSTYDATTKAWSAYKDLGTGRIDFKNIIVKITNDPAVHTPLEGRLVNLGIVDGAENFLLNDANTFQTRTAFGMADMLNGINVPNTIDGLMYNFDQVTNILTIGDYHETVKLREATTLTDSTLICIYDVNHPMTEVNSLRLADFKTLMQTIHNTSPVQKAIKSVMFVQNSAQHAEVLWVGLDPVYLTGTQLGAVNYAMNLKYNPIVAPNDNSSNPAESGYYTVKTRSTDFFTSGGTVYNPVEIKDVLTGLEGVRKFAVAATDTSVKAGTTVYITSTVVNGYYVVRPSTIRSADLNTANIKAIITAGSVETLLYGNTYHYDAVNKIAYAKAANGITYASYGSTIPYIEISATTLGTFQKVASYAKKDDDTLPVTGFTTSLQLTYDMIDVRHIASNGLINNIGKLDWTPGTVSGTGTVYVVPYNTNGGFAIIVVK